MKQAINRALLGVVLMALAALPVGADELTVTSILAAQQSGAPADGIITMVNDPDNTVAMTAGDIVTLHDAGVPETVITAIWAKVPAPEPELAPLQPDDARLVDLARLITSGMSESIITEQVKQEGQTYNLSVNDLLYLKQNGAQESTIVALMAMSRAEGAPTAMAPPDGLVFDDLVLVKKGLWGFFKKDRQGRLVMDGDTLRWEDARGSEGSFQLQTSGIDRVWYTCEARPSESFCHQINFKIVKGDLYRFQDSRRDQGSNAAVVDVMEALRTYFPRLDFATPSIGD